MQKKQKIDKKNLTSQRTERNATTKDEEKKLEWKKKTQRKTEMRKFILNVIEEDVRATLNIF